MLSQEIEIVKSAVSEVFGVPEYLLDKKTRKREVVEARQAAMAMMKTIDKSMALQKIGNSFGSGYDHSTVIHAQHTVASLLATDKRYSRLYKESLGKAMVAISGKIIQDDSTEIIVQEKEVISLLMLSCEGLPIRTGLMDTIS